MIALNIVSSDRGLHHAQPGNIDNRAYLIYAGNKGNVCVHSDTVDSNYVYAALPPLTNQLASYQEGKTYRDIVHLRLPYRIECTELLYDGERSF